MGLAPPQKAAQLHSFQVSEYHLLFRHMLCLNLDHQLGTHQGIYGPTCLTLSLFALFEVRNAHLGAKIA